jgi:hypothetical protein
LLVLLVDEALDPVLAPELLVDEVFDLPVEDDVAAVAVLDELRAPLTEPELPWVPAAVDELESPGLCWRVVPLV